MPFSLRALAKNTQLREGVVGFLCFCFRRSEGGVKCLVLRCTRAIKTESIYKRSKRSVFIIMVGRLPGRSATFFGRVEATQTFPPRCHCSHNQSDNGIRDYGSRSANAGAYQAVFGALQRTNSTDVEYKRTYKSSDRTQWPPQQHQTSSLAHLWNTSHGSRLIEPRSSMPSMKVCGVSWEAYSKSYQDHPMFVL